MKTTARGLAEREVSMIEKMNEVETAASGNEIRATWRVRGECANVDAISAVEEKIARQFGYGFGTYETRVRIDHERHERIVTVVALRRAA